VKRLVAREIDSELCARCRERFWRTVTHKKYQLRCDLGAALQNQVESSEEAIINVSSFVSISLASVARRIAEALADGVPTSGSGRFGGWRLRPAGQLCDALGACADLNASTGGY